MAKGSGEKPTTTRPKFAGSLASDVLDQLWRSAHEFGADANNETARERWKRHAAMLLSNVANPSIGVY